MTNLLQLSLIKQLAAFKLEVELSLDSAQGQVLVLFGPSGSGKTMTIKCVAGIVEPEAGFINIAGRVVFDSQKRLNLSLPQRNIGYVPQNYALFPHLKVSQNIGFGLFKWPQNEARARIAEMINLMQLEGLAHRYPRELSGGQQQRVALARALAPRPTLLLLDEPFAALDTNIRHELRQNLALLSHDLGLPIVFITHDLEEAYMLADIIAVYDMGRILQIGRREDIFYRPTSPKVAHLLGQHNLFEGRVLATQAELILVQTLALGEIWATIPSDKAPPLSNSTVTVFIRPENFNLQNGSKLDVPVQSLNNYEGQIISEVARGSLYTLFMKLGQNNNQAETTYDIEVESPSQHYVNLKAQCVSAHKWGVSVNPQNVHLIY